MLRGATSFSCPRSKQHLDQLSGCARTLPTNFHWTDVAVSCVCFSSSLFDATSLFAWIGLRCSAYIETPALGILDRYGLGAWSDCHPVVCPTVLFHYKIAWTKLNCV